MCRVCRTQISSREIHWETIGKVNTETGQKISKLRSLTTFSKTTALTCPVVLVQSSPDSSPNFTTESLVGSEDQGKPYIITSLVVQGHQRGTQISQRDWNVPTDLGRSTSAHARAWAHSKRGSVCPILNATQWGRIKPATSSIALTFQSVKSCIQNKIIYGARQGIAGYQERWTRAWCKLFGKVKNRIEVRYISLSIWSSEKHHATVILRLFL